MHTSHKVMHVCVIKALKVKRYKRKNYFYVIIFHTVNPTQNNAAWVQHVLWVFHEKLA
jgi:hypothetical protein